MAHRYVVFARRLKGFDVREQAVQFARLNFPAVVCERRPTGDGGTELVEIARHDYHYDEARDEWHVTMLEVGS